MEARVPGVEARGFDTPDETRTPDKTKVDVVRMAGTTAARFTFEPGWRWSECVKPVAGTESCQVRRAREQNAFLKAHSWVEYAAWHLGLTEGAAEETKARYAFVYGDFRRLHRMGLIACHYRAAEWRHKEIELAAHELLQYLDRKSA